MNLFSHFSNEKLRSYRTELPERDSVLLKWKWNSVTSESSMSDSMGRGNSQMNQIN